MLVMKFLNGRAIPISDRRNKNYKTMKITGKTGNLISLRLPNSKPREGSGDC